MTVSWNANPRASSYRVYRNGSLIASPTGISVNVTGLTASTAYSYVVSSYSATGEGPPSAAVIGTTQTVADTTPPTVPAITATSISSTSLRVALTPSTDSGTGVRDYRLEYKTSAASTWTVAGANLLASQFPYDIGGLVPSTAYNTRCSATDNAGNTSAYSATSNATTPAGSSLTWTGGSATIQSVPLSVGVAADIDIASYVTGEIAIEALSGSVPGMAYSAETMRLSGTPTTASPTENDYEMSFRATDTPTAEQDWLDRISGSGVVWYHAFASDAEVTNFRWSSGYGGGNDPLGVGRPLAGNVQRLAGVGPGGRDCLQITRPAGTGEVGTHWWRPYSPLIGSGNGRGQDDPGANGTLTAQSYAPTDGGSQVANWGQRGFYGHPSYHTGSVFNGSEYWLQMRVQMDPRRAQSGMPTVGKLSFQTVTYISYVNQEIVTYSGGQHSAIPTQNNFQMYQGWNYTPMWDSAVGGGGSVSNRQPGKEGGACNPSANPNTCWAWSGGWDTVLYHVVPGRHAVDEQVIQVYGAHEGETSYTRIWDDVYTPHFETGYPFGYNALILSTYNNGNNCPSEFWHRWGDIIFSHSFIPCPQV